MKIQVIKSYDDWEPNKHFDIGEEYSIKNSDINDNSDYYHIWNRSKLWIIPKENCETI